MKKQLILLLFLVGIHYHETIFAMESTRPTVCIADLEQAIHDLAFPAKYIALKIRNLCKRSPEEYFQPEETEPADSFDTVIEYMKNAIQHHRRVFNNKFMTLLCHEHNNTTPVNLLASIHQSVESLRTQDHQVISAKLIDIRAAFFQSIVNDKRNIEAFFDQLATLLARKSDSIYHMESLLKSYFSPEEFIPGRGIYGEILFEKSISERLHERMEKKHKERLEIHEIFKKRIKESIKDLECMCR